jgi:hypothetical protein
VKRSSSKKRAGKVKPDDSSTTAPEKPAVGLPDPESVVAEKVFKSPKGNVYRIFKTIETDAYDKPARPKGGRKKGH